MGSVGCHDVTNTCSTKSVMQLLQQSVPESCVSASLRLFASASRLVSSRLRQTQAPPPHTLVQVVYLTLNPPHLGALVRLRLCPPSQICLPGQA